MKIAIALMISLAAQVQMWGQMRDNRDKEMTCQDWGGYNRQVHRCDIREQTISATGQLTVNPGANGGVTVKGWLRNEVLVRSRMEAWADTDADANAVLSQIRVDANTGVISASGPGDRDRSWDRGWGVSFEIFVPRITNLDLKAFNGGLHVSDVEGTLHAETNNGGIHLARIAGDVKGVTTNGGVHVELMGTTWQGRQLELSTINGGVNVSMPQNYSAHVQAETINGRIRSDFPITVTGEIRPRTIDTNFGSGGPLIHVSTQNGGVNLRRG